MTMLAILAIFGGVGSVSAATLELITHSDQPMQNEAAGREAGFTVTVHLVNGIQDVSRRLSEGLPKDPQQAERIAQQRLTQHQAAIKATVGSLNRIVELEAQGIDRYPVIVINQQYVIYGVTDLAVAVGHWQQWQEQQGEDE